MGGVVVVHSDALGRASGRAQTQLSRVKRHPVLVAASAKTYAVIEPLLEHPQPGHQGTIRRVLGDSAGGDAGAEALLAGHAAGGDPRHSAEGQRLAKVVQRAPGGGDDHLRRALDLRYVRASCLDGTVDVLFLALL